MNVKTTRLYKTLAPRIRKQDRKFFGEALQQVADAGSGISGGEYDLSAAFVWWDTPQGHDFWSELHKRLRVAGHYAEIEQAGA